MHALLSNFLQSLMSNTEIMMWNDLIYSHQNWWKVIFRINTFLHYLVTVGWDLELKICKWVIEWAFIQFECIIAMVINWKSFSISGVRFLVIICNFILTFKTSWRSWNLNHFVTSINFYPILFKMLCWNYLQILTWPTFYRYGALTTCLSASIFIYRI